MTSQPKPPITPQTKVAELLDACPELEEVLVQMAPPFKKLRNPVLRRTIARVTSLEKAASVANLPLRELITGLRSAAGQPVDDEGADAGEDRPAAVRTDPPTGSMPPGSSGPSMRIRFSMKTVSQSTRPSPRRGASGLETWV
jgi:hypothetical protein